MPDIQCISLQFIDQLKKVHLQEKPSIVCANSANSAWMGLSTV